MARPFQPPPIQYLPAFEAAARLRSFKAAGNELSISASAISQQIKSLEGFLGISLFERMPREVRLSAAGYTFYSVAEQTLNQYQAGCSRFAEQYHSSTLRISMDPYTAHEVIIPRLHDFYKRHQAIELIIETSMRAEDLTNSHLDGAIRFGQPPWAACESQKICEAQCNFVASEEYLESHPFTAVEDFRHQTLLHTRRDINDWQRVFDLSGFKGEPAKEFFFDSHSAALRAAEEGLGLALGIVPTINAALREGKFVAVSKQHFPMVEAFYLVSKVNDGKKKSYQALHRWLAEVFAGI